MENLQENQEFSSRDVIGVFVCIGVLLLVAMNAFRYASDDYLAQAAQKEMVKLSRQLMTHGEDFQPNQDQSTEVKLRGPASVDSQNVIQSLGLEGKIAKDPWGEPYQYKFFERASKVYGVAIWSNGPNGSKELTEKHFLRAGSGRVFRIMRAGDDLTHIEMSN